MPLTLLPIEEDEPVAAVTPTKPPVTAPVVNRPSDPGKQALAGISDMIGDIPAIFGLAGAGGQAAYNTVTGDEEASLDTLEKNFVKALTDGGIDDQLFSVAQALREKTNEVLDIEDAVSSEDQVARTLGNFIPIPGLKVLSSMGKGAKALRHSYNLLTPAVRTGKGFGKRSLIQSTLGTGLDQGIRAATDRPTMFSDEALHGTPLEDAATPQIASTSSSLTLEPLEDEAPDIAVGDGQGLNRLQEMNEKVRREEDNNRKKFWLATLGAAAGSAAGLRYLQKAKANQFMAGQDTSKLGEFAADVETANIQQLPGVLWKGTKDFGNYSHEMMVDRGQAIGNALHEMGHSADTVDSVISNTHTDPVDIALNFWESATLGQGFVLPKGKVMHAGMDLANRRMGLGADKMKVFDDAMLAQTEMASRNAGKTPSIWGNARTDPELQALIKAGTGDTDINWLMRDVSETFEGLLAYQVHRKIITPTMAEDWLKNATYNGRVGYMPLYANTKQGMLRKLSRSLLGINTTEGKKLDVIAEYSPRGSELGDDLVNPVEALRRYSISTIANANEQSFKANVLSNLAGVFFRGKGNVGRFVMKNGKKVEVPNHQHPFNNTARDTAYVGKATSLDDPERIPIAITGKDARIAKIFKAGDLEALKAGKHGDELVTVHHQGELHVFHVPDAGIRAALDLNPRISNGLQFMSHWKNVFTRGTTGDFSIFAPLSHAFSAQQVASNTFATQGAVQGVKSIGRSIGGTKSLLVANGAKDLANYLSYRIATNTGIGRAMPQLARRLQETFARKFESSMLNQVRAETGKTVTGLGNVGHGTIDEILGQNGQAFSNHFGAAEMGTVWKLWKSWNNAWHEGPAYGAMMKHIGDTRLAGKKIDAKVIRDAVDHSKSLAGDMRRIGASKWAERFNASVPFSAAMVQSWNSLGAAAKSNPGRFVMGAGALVGMPTISEMAWNANLEASNETLYPDQEFIESGGLRGKQWNYNDYYWNGFTTQQRASNFIYMIPGKPPWEAQMIPVSPEWGLFRGIVMDAADTVFGFSDVGNLNVVNTPNNDIEGTDRATLGRSQFWGSVTRVADLPTPPLVAATMSAFGLDVRLGLAREIKDDPENPGTTTSLVRTVPLGQGGRITSRSASTKNELDGLDIDTSAIIQDIFGAAGAAYIQFHNAVSSSRDIGLDWGEAVANGAEAFGSGMKTQAKYLQSLWGKSASPSEHDEIAQNVFVRKAALKRLMTDWKAYMGAGVVKADGKPIIGNTVIPWDDPQNLELAAGASTMNKTIALLDKRIAELKENKRTMTNATDLGTAQEKRDKIDAKTLEISSLKAKQLAQFYDFEQVLSKHLTDRYGNGKKITVDLSTHVPGPNVRGDSLVPRPQLSPRTSQ